MKLAILSDIHDQVWHLRAALAALDEADALICCGDLCSPFVVNLLATGFAGRPIHIVFGNNDGDLYRIGLNAARHGQVQLHGELFEGELGGCRLAVNHYPELALGLADAGRYDLVCYGHNHRFAIERRQQTLLINPGPIMGYEPARGADVPPTFVVYDTASGQASAYALRRAADGTLQAAPYS